MSPVRPCPIQSQRCHVTALKPYVPMSLRGAVLPVTQVGVELRLAS